MMNNLLRQVEEVEAVKATYPEAGALVFSSAEALDFEQAKALVENGHRSVGWTELEELRGTVTLTGCVLNRQPVGIRFRLPVQYPRTPPVLHVACSADSHTHNHLTEAVSTCLEDNAGAEVLLLALEALREATTRLSEQMSAATPVTAHPQTPLAFCVGRKLIWFHHIKSVTKRKNIVGWAKELGIRGFSKPGFPGVVVCEGHEADIQEYCVRVRGMRWQAMSIRAEERQEAAPQQLEAAYRFKARLQELGEADMDVLAAKCRSAGLHHLFLAAIKL